jgi:hypothetical protein
MEIPLQRERDLLLTTGTYIKKMCIKMRPPRGEIDFGCAELARQAGLGSSLCEAELDEVKINESLFVIPDTHFCLFQIKSIAF